MGTWYACDCNDIECLLGIIKLKKFQIQILHHIRLSTEIEAEDQDQALKMAETLSNDIKPTENYASSELSITEIEA